MRPPSSRPLSCHQTTPVVATAPPVARLPVVLLILVVAGLVLSAVRPYDRATWWMEVAPVLLALPLLVATHRRFPFTPLLYGLMAFFAAILMAGGHWTYARVPLGDWVRDAFDLSRNHYDRFGHFFQGVIPAMVARELIVRTSPLRPGGWLFTVCTAIALSVSALYELVEWASAVWAGEGATDFLGSQGDPWDAQADMLCALSGAVLAQILLGRLHDRQLARVGRPPATQGRRIVVESSARRSP